MCTKSQQNLLDSMVLGSRLSFQFFRQKTWFLGNNRVFCKFFYDEVLHCLISIIESKENQTKSPDFMSTT